MALKQTTVFFSNNSVFTDLSLILNDWLRGSTTIDYTTAQDYIYVGRYKPFSTLWFQLTTPNVTAATMTVKYWDGTQWTALTPLMEDTKGWTRSGWLKIEIPDDWEANEVNSTEKFWLQLSFSATFGTPAVARAVGLVFADDLDLKKQIPSIDKYLADGETNFILRHVAAQEQIVQRLRTEGKFKVAGETGLPEDLDEFDLNRPEQMRVAATWLALHLLYVDLSNSGDDDSFWKKAMFYKQQYDDSYGAVLLSLDVDDSGFEGPDEQSAEFSDTLFVRD